MSSRTLRTLAAYASDGTEVTWQNSAGYDVAGIVHGVNGRWAMVANGYSWKSVESRARAWVNRNFHTGNLTGEFETARIYEATVPKVRQYFGHHRVWIHETYGESLVWVPGNRQKATRAVLRMLAKEGVTAFGITDGERTADFQAAELDLRLGQSAKTAQT